MADGLAYAEIARRLDRPTSTITREVMRSGGPTELWYQSMIRSARVLATKAETSVSGRSQHPSRAALSGRPSGPALCDQIADSVRLAAPRAAVPIAAGYVLLSSEAGAAVLCGLSQAAGGVSQSSTPD